ncbi:hypothetical protein [Ruminococcus sp. AM31-15AC]|uniref:hypothetical protein n=1 Tax=Ruminococcus sp. AM31-15AC TaxID=2293202 RepID=UPI002094BE7C
MNVKKIIKGIIGLGAVAGIAYLSYKVGESNGEVNERFREKYGDDEDDISSDDDEEEADNYYGTCFEPKYVEPDDGCLAPASVTAVHYDIGKEHTISEAVPAEKCEVPDEQPKKEKPLPQMENKECIGKEVVPPPVKKYAPLSSITIKGVSRGDMENLLIWMIRRKSFYKSDIIYHLRAGAKKVNMIYDAFTKAGYISKEENEKKTYCNLTKEDFYWLLLEE